jgi:hypothetical protein
MPCPKLEDLLSGKSGTHTRHCRDCKALLDTYAEVDSVFESAFSGISSPAGLSAAIYARILPIGFKLWPSPVPEFLDLIGWAAVLGIAAIVLPRFMLPLSSIWAVFG